MRCVLVLCAALAGPAGAVDVLVLDRGGGTAGVAAAVDAVNGAGDVAVTGREAEAADVRYASGCTDGECYARAAAAAGVARVVLVESNAVSVVDATTAVLVRMVLRGESVGAIIGALAHSERLGTIDTQGTLTSTRILVDGVIYQGEFLRAGKHTLTVATPEGISQVAHIVVEPGRATPIPKPELFVAPPPPPEPAPPPLHAGWVVGGVGAGVAVLGAVVGGTGTVLWTTSDVPQVGDDAALRRTGPVLEDVGFTVAAIGVVVGLAGVVWVALEP